MKGKYFVALGVSLLAIGAAAGFVGTKRAAEAKADYGPTRTVYVDLHDASWWIDGKHEGLDNFRAQYWKGGEETTVVTPSAVTYVGLSYLWEVEIPSDVDGFLFNAYKGNTAYWDKAYQTTNINFDGSKNLLTLNDGGLDQKLNWSWDTLPEASSGTVYFVNGAGFAQPKIHYWGDASQSTWPGENMVKQANIKLHVGENDYEIWSYNVPSCRYIQFNDGTELNKTLNLPITADGAYFYNVDGKYAPVVSLLAKIQASLGTANIVSDDNKEYSNTICGISAANKTAILNAYQELLNCGDAEIVAVARNSTLTTYDPDDYSATAPVKIQDIAAELSALGGGSPLLQTNAFIEKNGTIITISAAISMVAVGALIGFLAFRKRKIQL